MKKIIFCLLFSVLMLAGCTHQPVHDTDFLLNTVSTITVYDNISAEKSQKIIEGCFSLCRSYENILSRTVKNSDISKLNYSNGKPIQVNDETAELITLAENYSLLSNGKFDITIEPAAELWNFTGDNPHVPSEEEISKAAEKINYKNVSVTGNTVILSGNGTKIDLGGIAKGYIGDKAKEYLVENNIKKAIIDLGGNILTLCPEDDEKGFNIGIQKPFGEVGELYGIVNIYNGTVVTSGIYERYFEENGKMYHHILDTSNAMPVENNLYSVTIIAQSSADADALSTTCFAMGLEDAMALIETLPDVEAIFITNDLEYHGTSGIGTNISFEKY